MTSDLDIEVGPSRGDRIRGYAYRREFMGGRVLYAVLLVVAITFGELDGDSRLRFVWAVLSVPGVVAMIVAVWRHVRRLDECQRGLLVGSLALWCGNGGDGHDGAVRPCET